MTANIPVNPGEHITRFFTSGQSILVLTSDRQIYAWGNNLYGVLFTGASTTYESTPVNVTANFNLVGDESIVDIEQGLYFAVALTTNNRIITVGLNDHGQLGNGTVINSVVPIDISNNYTLHENESITNIETVYFGSAGFLTSEGRLFGWGSNSSYTAGGMNVDFSLCDGTRVDRLVPIQMDPYFNLASGETIIAFQSSWISSVVITSNGRVFTWGGNRLSQLGDGTTTSRLLPTNITGYFALETDETVVSFGKSKQESTLVFTNLGRMFGWGYGGYYSLFYTTANRIYPTYLTIFDWATLESEAIDYNEGLTLLDPEREGYTFLGWYTNTALTTPLVATNMPANDLTIYAKWSVNAYTISFEEYGGSTVSNITQNYGTNVVKPANPTKTGYTFGGWYVDSEFSTPYAFTYMHAEDIILYAKWIANPYTISFDTNGGSAVGDITQDYLSELTAPTAPTKDGYTFDGWYTTEAWTTAYVFSTMPAGNITIYAKWTLNNYTIDFVENGGSEVANITAAYGSSVIGPVTPTKTGHSFEDWYSDPELTIPYVFSTMPLNGITLYAKWTINQYTLSFDANGGSDVDMITQDYGTAVAAPTAPV
ncbi:MAG: InlB B-repeat-containing protein [Bacillus subtilis]|nr:InlB B-repeat-containing protein [Bacillus subtilis]